MESPSGQDEVFSSLVMQHAPSHAVLASSQGPQRKLKALSQYRDRVGDQLSGGETVASKGRSGQRDPERQNRATRRSNIVESRNHLRAELQRGRRGTRRRMRGRACTAGSSRRRKRAGQEVTRVRVRSVPSDHKMPDAGSKHGDRGWSAEAS